MTTEQTTSEKKKGIKLRAHSIYEQILEDDMDLLPVKYPKKEIEEEVAVAKVEIKVDAKTSKTGTEPKPMASAKEYFEELAKKSIQSAKVKDKERMNAELQTTSALATTIQSKAAKGGLTTEELDALVEAKIKERKLLSKLSSHIDLLSEKDCPTGGFKTNPYKSNMEYTKLPNQFFNLLFFEKVYVIRLVSLIYRNTLGLKSYSEAGARREWVVLTHDDCLSHGISNNFIREAINRSLEAGYIGRAKVGLSYYYWIKFKDQPDPILPISRRVV